MAHAGQMNIRLDIDLKAQGDAVLAAAGFSPSKAVRALWELACHYKDKPQELAALLEPDKATEEERARTVERERKLAVIRDWDEQIKGFYEELGYQPDADDPLSKMPYKQLEEYLWYEDHKAELGLTDEDLERIAHESL